MNIVVLLVNEIIKSKNYNFLPENLKLAWNFLIKNQISDIYKNIIFSLHNFLNYLSKFTSWCKSREDRS